MATAGGIWEVNQWTGHFVTFSVSSSPSSKSVKSLKGAQHLIKPSQVPLLHCSHSHSGTHPWRLFLPVVQLATAITISVPAQTPNSSDTSHVPGVLLTKSALRSPQRLRD